MTRLERWASGEDQPRLRTRGEGRLAALYTVALDPEGGPVYRERQVRRAGEVLRHWDPSRSKLAAARLKRPDLPLPREGGRWLYLGAATGTTASHVADLTGPQGQVIAVERSVRSFARLLRLAERYANLLPLLADARHLEDHAGDIGPCDGLYADVAQPDQVAIVEANARLFLDPSARIWFVLKTSSLGRGPEPKEHLAAARRSLESAGIEVESTVGLEPFHRRHYLIVGAPTRRLFRANEAR